MPFQGFESLTRHAAPTAPATSTDQVVGRSSLCPALSGRVRLFTAIHALICALAVGSCYRDGWAVPEISPRGEGAVIETDEAFWMTHRMPGHSREGMIQRMSTSEGVSADGNMDWDVVSHGPQ